ncbi:unnamed protein product [Knipowitschia caucasica]
MTSRWTFCFFLLTPISGLDPPCRCTVHPTQGLMVNCSSPDPPLRLHLPRDITQLQLSNTGLRTVPPGLFDSLNLKNLSISGNPFHCDCKIQYLRNWLMVNGDVVTKQPTCASPINMAQKAIRELDDDFFSSCVKSSCVHGLYLVMTGVTLVFVVLLCAYALRLAKESTITLYIDERHAILEASSLRSQKPKHRRSWGFLNKPVEPMERPLLGMELLPQTLQKKPNRKMKET